MRTVLVAIVCLTAIYAVAEAQQPPASAKKPSPFQQAIDDIEEARKSSGTTDAVKTSAGKAGNNFVYRWYPLKTGSDEAVMGP